MFVLVKANLLFFQVHLQSSLLSPSGLETKNLQMQVTETQGMRRGPPALPSARSSFAIDAMGQGIMGAGRKD